MSFSFPNSDSRLMAVRAARRDWLCLIVGRVLAVFSLALALCAMDDIASVSALLRKIFTSPLISVSIGSIARYSFFCNLFDTYVSSFLYSKKSCLSPSLYAPCFSRSA